MDKSTLNRAIEIKREIEVLKKEISLLPITTNQRNLFKFMKGMLEKRHNGLYAIKLYTHANEVIKLNNEDINALLDLRIDKIKKLEKELESL